MSTDARAFPGDDPRFDLVLREALRSTTQQQSQLDNLRGRAGILISAAAVATSFLGGAALTSGELGPASWLAILAFLALGFEAIEILMPGSGWRFRSNATTLLDDWIGHPTKPSLARMQEQLARKLEANYRVNETPMGGLYARFSRAVLFLYVNVVFWLLELA